MKFRFIGDPKNGFSGPDAFEKFGLNFSRSEWTDVDDPVFVAKLLGSDHYEHAGAFAPASAVPVLFAKNEDERRAALVSEAEALGIDVDGRWSNATLERKINEARA
jgi:hypothetical protein